MIIQKDLFTYLLFVLCQQSKFQRLGSLLWFAACYLKPCVMPDTRSNPQ